MITEFSIGISDVNNLTKAISQNYKKEKEKEKKKSVEADGRVFIFFYI
jgi:hypothetical protein